MTGLFLHCRAGFEGECAAEIQARAAACGLHGHCRARPGTAYVLFETPHRDGAARLPETVALADLVFTRQWFVVQAFVDDLPVGDRVSPIVAGLATLGAPAAALCLETPDTNEGKALSGLCRKLQRPLEEGLRAAGLLAPGADGAVRLHACFLSGTSAHIGYIPGHNSSPWPMGVPRLRFPRGAPSRSTLKLEEAFLHFLTPAGRASLLVPGMRAVDLGAAPGGWTWQLARRHIHVTAVDNGTLDPLLMDSGLVDHVRADGFHFRPARPVGWIVCDMVEQPARIAALAAKWMSNGWCRHTIFNLKLPMKRRYHELQRCLDLIRHRLDAAGVPYRLGCKQLYHDREEVTVYVSHE